MQQINFAIVGAGWRTETFLRIASAVGEMNVVGVVARKTEAAQQIETAWGVPTFTSINDLLEATKPDFVVVSVSAEAMPEVCTDLAKLSIPVLAETPPATSISQLRDLYGAISKLNAKIQVAEQFWAQPLHFARQAVINSGILGDINQINLSVCHGYHAMSLIRRHLGIRGECPVIRSFEFAGRVVEGPGRSGPPDAEKVVSVQTEHAVLEFGDRIGIYEFCQPQYRSWIRGQRICIRGTHGEIIDDRVSYLQDPTTPIYHSFLRHEGGQNGNHEGLHLKAIQLGASWVYTNQFAPARLSDEELAMATCLVKMRDYLATGEDFYSLGEACQDQYLALSVRAAIESGNRIVTQPQIWSDDI